MSYRETLLTLIRKLEIFKPPYWTYSSLILPQSAQQKLFFIHIWMHCQNTIIDRLVLWVCWCHTRGFLFFLYHLLRRESEFFCVDLALNLWPLEPQANTLLTRKLFLQVEWYLQGLISNKRSKLGCGLNSKSYESESGQKFHFSEPNKHHLFKMETEKGLKKQFLKKLPCQNFEWGMKEMSQNYSALTISLKKMEERKKWPKIAPNLQKWKITRRGV